MIKSEFLDILACPTCEGGLTESGEIPFLVCSHCGLKYPIRNGVPVLLREEAEPTT